MMVQLTRDPHLCDRRVLCTGFGTRSWSHKSHKGVTLVVDGLCKFDHEFEEVRS